MGYKADIRSFVTETFDYLEHLNKCSIDRTVNRYLLEYIANGFATYGRSADAFIENVDEWIRKLVKIYPEIGFNHESKQVIATIDLIDQFVIIDDELLDALLPVIEVQEKYGLLITYRSKSKNIDKTTTLSKFFEYIEDMYPVIKDRYKGLGSSSAKVSEEVIMDPRTRRIVRVTANDIETMKTMAKLVGDSKENIRDRKEMLMNFKFTMDMIDN